MAAGAALPLLAQIGAGVGGAAIGALGRSQMSDKKIRDFVKGYYIDVFELAKRGIPYDLGWAARQRALSMMPFNPAVFWLGFGMNPAAQIFYALLSSRV